ncbi:MAG TPA: hypothetical protein VHX59_02545 [Mycobacteriales bacterium]|nr:hypothetical protein [Mycobacteriales bacterium]
MAVIPRSLARLVGITGDWWIRYRALPWRIRRGIRKRVWAGHAENDPRLMEITLGYAEWVSSRRAFRLRVLALTPIVLMLPIAWLLTGYNTATVVLVVVYVVVYGGIKVGFDKRRTGRAEDAAMFTRSTLRRHAGHVADTKR